MRRSQLLVTLGCFVVCLVYELSRYRQGRAAGYDLGIFHQAVRAYSQFRAPYVPLKGDHFLLLGDHFHPILAIIAPLYWIWDDSRMLLIVQAVLVGWTVWLVFGVAHRQLRSVGLATVLAAGFGVSWPIQRLADFDFHEVAFALPLLVLAIDAAHRRTPGRLLLASAGLLLVREDLGMVVALLGVLWLAGSVRRRADQPKKWWPGLVLLVGGVAAFAVITAWLLPWLSPTGAFAYWDYTALGPDAGSAIWFMVTHPITTVVMFFTPWTKTITLAYLLVPLLCLPLRSPISLLSLPLLAQRFFSDREYLWGTQFHYSAPIQVIFVMATIEVLARHGQTWRRRLVLVMAVIQLILPAVDSAIIAARHLENASSNTPYIRLFGSGWTIGAHLADRARIVAQIPADTCVEADDRIVLSVIDTNRVTLPGLSSHAPDFVVLDLAEADVGAGQGSPQHFVDLYRRRGYREQATSGEVVLLVRAGAIRASAECSPTAG